MSNKKVFIDESNEGVTYIGIANYPRPGYNEEGYVANGDIAKTIWQIRKVTDTDGVQEFSYPNGDSSAKYAWSKRTTYTYL